MKRILIIFMLKRIALEQKGELRSRFGGHAGPPPQTLIAPTPEHVKAWGLLFVSDN